ncbi:MAG: hypothetical protein JWM76_2150 [Pseudonocardiales bacterium]|nr:hypothetical protein [Pseudonocardiales bacterium]
MRLGITAAVGIVRRRGVHAGLHCRGWYLGGWYLGGRYLGGRYLGSSRVAPGRAAGAVRATPQIGSSSTDPKPARLANLLL